MFDGANPRFQKSAVGFCGVARSATASGFLCFTSELHVRADG